MTCFLEISMLSIFQILKHSVSIGCTATSARNSYRTPRNNCRESKTVPFQEYGRTPVDSGVCSPMFEVAELLHVFAWDDKI